MPVISMFFGIRIYIYLEEGGQHKVPHVQAIYDGYEMAIDFAGNVLAGSLPRKQQAMVVAWVLMHEEELRANYELMKDNQPPFRIEPLK